MAEALVSSVGINLFSSLVVKTCRLLYIVIQSYQNSYQAQGDQQARLVLQHRILTAAQKQLSPEVHKHITETDRLFIDFIIYNLHSTFVEYVTRYCMPVEDNDMALLTMTEDELSIVADFSKRLDLARKKDKVFGRTVAEVAQRVWWAVWRKGRTEDLVVRAEFWGNQLSALGGWVIPWSTIEVSKIATTVQLVVDPRVQQFLTVKGDLTLQLKYVQGDGIMDMSHSPVTRFESVDFGLVDCTQNDLGELGDNIRFWGEYTKRQPKEYVIVEKKSKSVCDTDPGTARKELRTLVRQLATANKQSSFHVLHCRGFYEIDDFFGLIFDPPLVDCKSRSLQSLLTMENIELTYDMQSRVDVAKALAWTVFHLHSVGWVHKSLCSKNIVFFRKRGKNYTWSDPFVLGFDLSRASTTKSKPRIYGNTEPWKDMEWEERAYVHPDRQGATFVPFHKLHDLYSLGVVLLDIASAGVYHPFGALQGEQRENWSKRDPDVVRNKYLEHADVIKNQVPGSYQAAVMHCLEGSFDVVQEEDDSEDYRLLGAFRQMVCERLDQIRL